MKTRNPEEKNGKQVMKFSITKPEFLRGLTRVQTVVESRNTMPILANVLLEARAGRAGSSLDLVATDLEVSIRTTHTCEVERAGSVTVAAKKLFEIVRELPEEKIQVEVSDNSFLTLRCARAAFTLAGTTAEEYPTVPTISPERTVSVQAAVLGDMIERTMYAASSDETRFNLNGVFFERLSDSGKLRMVATDGHRLARVDRMLGSQLEGLEHGVTVPRKGLAGLKRLVDEEEADDVELGFEGNNGLARRGGVTLVMRLIEGEFPNYRQVIPGDLQLGLVLPVEPFQHALRRVALLATERSRAIKLELTEGRLAISANTPDVGQASEELDVDYAGPPLTIAFNASYLLDAVAASGAKEIRISFRDHLSPALLTPTGDEDSLAVVMPMRL
jgi:DNA polymerase-3 subunit beta